MRPGSRSTDYGTVVLHALIAGSFLVLVATGLRIATDDPETGWLVVLDPLLPTRDLWFNHTVAGAVLMSALVAYFGYVRLARLQHRVRLDWARIQAMLRPGRARWAAINVAVYWVMMLALATEVVTGVLLFAGVGGIVLVVHRDVTFLCLATVVSHVALHAKWGGWPQLLRILRPARLTVPDAPPDLAELLAREIQHRARLEQKLREVVRPRSGPPAAPPARATGPTRLEVNPFATALALALVVGGLAIGAEQATRPILRVMKVPSAAAPVLDGDLSDPVWARTAPVAVRTTQGGDFGATHESRIELRAVHDGEFAYFALVWDDPTRSLKHHPLVKRDGTWRIAASRPDLGDETRYNEDKLAILLTPPGLPLIGSAIHLARLPLADRPPGVTGRGLHYTEDGSIADVWQWRAAHAGPYGHIDNCHFGGPASPGSRSSPPQSHYRGGFSVDPGRVPHMPNLTEVVKGKTTALVRPVRLPRDYKALAQAMGRLSDDPGESESDGSRWWMTMAESAPYSTELDRTIPDGTVIPGVLMLDAVETTHASIRGAARWAAGRWTLEIVRRLHTGSPHDVPIGSSALMWLAAFDHADKRHTRHIRPLRLEVDP
jgi:hypothetical protein